MKKLYAALLLSAFVCNNGLFAMQSEENKETEETEVKGKDKAKEEKKDDSKKAAESKDKKEKNDDKEKKDDSKKADDKAKNEDHAKKAKDALKCASDMPENNVNADSLKQIFADLKDLNLTKEQVEAMKAEFTAVKTKVDEFVSKKASDTEKTDLKPLQDFLNNGAAGNVSNNNSSTGFFGSIKNSIKSHPYIAGTSVVLAAAGGTFAYLAMQEEAIAEAEEAAAAAA